MDMDSCHHVIISSFVVFSKRICVDAYVCVCVCEHRIPDVSDRIAVQFSHPDRHRSVV